MERIEMITWLWIVFAIATIFLVPEPFDLLLLLLSLIPYIFYNLIYMDKKGPVHVTMSIQAHQVFERKVMSVGTGTKINFLKEYIGRNVLIIPLEDK